MAELFGRERSVVTKHIRNAFREGELDPTATSAKPQRGTQFRIWAIRTLREHLVRGYILDRQLHRSHVLHISAQSDRFQELNRAAEASRSPR